MNPEWDSIWYNGNIAVCEANSALIGAGAIAVKNGKIAWVGPATDLPGKPEALASAAYDLHGALLTPGLIDCHTHLVYAGNRANEFEMRLADKSYAHIAREGGGIAATVKATRAATNEELYAQSVKRLLPMLRNGVTTLEIKSGYGLDWENEVKILRVAAMLGQNFPVTICRTFLGAHTVPPEYANRADDYVTLLCESMLPELSKQQLAAAVDVFCENIAFDLRQTERIFQTAKKLGLAIKCHAEQLSASGGAELAARYQALSADHLEFLGEPGIAAMAQAGTVAVLLPGAYYYLRETRLPPVASLRKHKIPMAVATDCNPGTSPIVSLLLVMNMACILFGFTIEEALLAVTLHAARALGLARTHGSLVPGKTADFAIWDAERPAELLYYPGTSLLQKVIKAGLTLK